MHPTQPSRTFGLRIKYVSLRECHLLAACVAATLVYMQLQTGALEHALLQVYVKTVHWLCCLAYACARIRRSHGAKVCWHGQMPGASWCQQARCAHHCTCRTPPCQPHCTSPAASLACIDKHLSLCCIFGLCHSQRRQGHWVLASLAPSHLRACGYLAGHLLRGAP